MGLRIRRGYPGWRSTVETSIRRLGSVAKPYQTIWLPLTHVLENPWTAAQRFLEANELPMSYLDEVVRFIEKNTAMVSLGGEGGYSDPYTGSDSWTVV